MIEEYKEEKSLTENDPLKIIKNILKELEMQK